jgi:hypothetical protein
MKSVERWSALILLILLGCRKNDTPAPIGSKFPAKVFSKSAEEIKESDWLQPSGWKSTQQQTYSLYFSEVKSDFITDEIVDKGLVRIFKIAGSDKNKPEVSLPFEEIKDGQKIYWYYEITPGNIMIYADVYGKQNISPENFLFKYLILNKQMVQNLNEKGIHQTDMMEFPYKKMIELNH